MLCKQESMDQAVALLAPGGKLMLIGIPTFDRPNFAIDQLRRKELCIQNVRRQNECVDDAIRLLAQRPKTRLMITHRLNADQTGRAFEMVEGYQDGVIKAIIRF